MSNFTIAIIIILGVCGAVGFEFTYLKKKGIKIDSILKEASNATDEAGVIIKAGKSLTNNKVFDILDLVDNLAKKAVKAVQQLYISSQLSGDERKTKAKEIIQEGLKFAGIKETTELDALIDTVIESSVFDNKTDSEKKGQEENTLQKQVTQLKEEVQNSTNTTEKANQKVTELTQKLNTIQNTVNQATQTVAQ